MIKNAEWEVPPRDWEDEITEPMRVRWLLTKYLSHPPLLVRAPYADFDSLLCDPSGFLWGVFLPENTADSFQPPHIVRCKDRVIGPDNQTVQQPLPMAN